MNLNIQKYCLGKTKQLYLWTQITTQVLDYNYSTVKPGGNINKLVNNATEINYSHLGQNDTSMKIDNI